MHYSSHPPCTFHNRIARYLGVLVAAALVAALGLPSAAQAQTPAAPTVTGTGDGKTATGGGIAVSWVAARLPMPDTGGLMHNGYLVEYTEPGEPWAAAESVVVGDLAAAGVGEALDELPMPIPANDPRIHHGVWRVRVSYYAVKNKDAADVVDKARVIGKPSALTDYLHGPPTSAPTGLTAYDAGPDARRLVWDTEKGLTYQLRSTPDATDDDAWTDWGAFASGDTATKLKMGTEYTFEVRGLGASRAGFGNLFGPSVSTKEMMPVPTPTLPEIAALFLAMLLLGSGAYLLRRRQSGGLTPA